MTGTVLHTFRQRGSVVTGALGMAVCLFVFGSAMLDLTRGVHPAIPSFAALGAALLWVMLVRPSVKVTRHGVLLANPLRRTHIPWPLVVDFGTKWSLTVHTGERAYPAWAISSGMDRPKSALLPNISIGPGRFAASGADAHPAPDFRVTAGTVARELAGWLDAWERGSMPGQSAPGEPEAAADTGHTPAGAAIGVLARWNPVDVALLAITALAAAFSLLR